MATSKINQQENTQEVVASLQSAQQNTTGLNTEFKESVNLLNKMSRAMTDSISKIQSFEKSTINIKRIESEREKIQRKTNNLKSELNKVNAQDLADADSYIKKIQERKKEELLITKQAQLGLAVNNSKLTLIESEILLMEQGLNTERLKAIALLQSQNLLEERIYSINDELDSEKELSKEIGYTGKLLGLANKYLGIGGSYYKKIVEEARNGESTTKKWVIGLAVLAGTAGLAAKGINKITSGISSLAGGGGGGPISKAFSPVADLVSGIPLVGGMLSGIVKMLGSLADFATESASAVTLFARNLSLSESEARKINNHFSDLAHNSGDLLYNSRKFRELQNEISDATGLNNILSDKSLKTQIQLKELANIDLETRKELVGVSRISGVEQDKIVKSIMGQNSVIKNTVGVSFRWQQILKEASSLGGYLGLSFAKYPKELTKSLSTVKAMGLELKQLDSMADSFLDFESSISKEFEAQLLTGKDINLTKAREAFLNNDLATAASEITKQVGSSDDFLKMNRISATALAESFGMSRDSMAEMLKHQENFSKLGATDLKSYQQRVTLLSKTIEGQKELVSKLGEEEYSRVMSQTATEKIANFIDRIKESFATLISQPAFTGLLDNVMNFLSDPSRIQSFLGGITGFISSLIKGIAALLSGLDGLPFVSIDKNIINSIKSYGDQLESSSLGSLSASNQLPARSGGTSMQTNTLGGKSSAAPIYIMLSVDPVTGKTIEKVVSQQYYETHVGQMNKAG